jgi:hypothetical protein
MENKNIEREVEKEATEALEDLGNKKEKKRPGKGARIFGYIVAIIINLAILFVVNNLLNWNVSFVTGELNDSIYYISLSIIITSIANFIFIFYDGERFKNGVEIFSNIFSFIAAYMMFMNYPFDLNVIFNFNIDLIAQACLVLAMVGIAIATVVNFVRIFKPADKK